MKDLSWSDVTLEQYMLIQEIKKHDSLDIVCEIIKILFNIKDPESLPYTEFIKYSQELSFMSKDIERVPLKDKYEINNNTYILKNNVMQLTTSQVIDYRNYSKEDNHIAKILSVFLIPEGHKYNDGYDIEQVINDLLDLDIQTVVSILDFFQKCWVEFIKISRDYLTSQLNLKTIPEEKKKEIEEKMDLLQDLTSFH
jgi:hypothetical protein